MAIGKFPLCEAYGIRLRRIKHIHWTKDSLVRRGYKESIFNKLTSSLQYKLIFDFVSN